MTAYRRIVFLACVILLTVSTYFQAPLAQPAKSKSPPPAKAKAPSAQSIVACSPEKPIVRPGETIRLKAYATSPQGKPLQYTWSTSTGRVDQEGSEVRWAFTAVRVGVHEAKVLVSDGVGGLADCSVRVIVQAQPQGEVRGNRETGRSFLLPDQVETKGYGLYSYLLLGSRPTAATRARYLRAIEEYLRFPDITRFDNFNIPRRTLNITYLPMQVFPDEQILDRLADEHYGEVAEWILKRYDYERARVLLRGLPGAHLEGPYIVSVLKPPTLNNPVLRPYLYQDQSKIPPHLVSLWIKEFLNQAAQEQYWQPRTATQLVLKLRKAIGILAIALPEVGKALDGWIVWVS